MKRFLVFISVFFVAVSLFGADIQLTFLYTNDIHGQSHPFDYKNKVRDYKNIGGAARRTTLINSIRKTSKNRVFLLDIGDIAGRGEYERYYAQPEVKIMNYMKYDIMTMGNHEFKLDAFEKEQSPKAIDILHKRTEEAKFPMLCANVYNKETGKREFVPYKIIKEKGLRIAFVGMTSLKCRTYPETVHLTFADPAQEWKKILEEIKGKYDFLVFMSHLGDLHDFALANLYPEIDMIIEGDFHTFLTEPKEIDRGDHKTIICQTGELGVMLGRTDVTLDGKTFKIKDYRYKLIPVTDQYKEDKKVNEILSHYEKKENFTPVIVSNN